MPSFPVLDESLLDSSPFPLFASWYSEAERAGVPEPHAFALATADAEGFPSARILLLRGFDDRGFAFYTNYESRKGKELRSNPQAAMVFFWAALQRQIRVEGSVALLTPAESDFYFENRPVGHRLGAIASPQSQVIPNRAFLEMRMDETCKQHQGKDPTRPEHWGGYRLAPRSIEFWQGRENRLHDRIRYRLDGEKWIIERLAP